MYKPKAFVGQQLDPADPINNGLIAWWPLNEGGGSRLNDVRQGKDGTTILDPKREGGPSGGGILFNGSTQYANIPQTVTAFPFTISYWVKPIAYASGIHFSLYFSGSVYCVGGIFDATHYYTSRSGFGTREAALLKLGQWNHVVVAVTSTATDVVYFNGKVAPIYDNNGSFGSPIGAISTLAKRAGGTERFFNGSLSNVRVYNRLLSQDEAIELYKNPLLGLYTPTTAKYFITGAKTIAANTGSFILTGIANTLKVARLITSSTGDFTIVGNTTNLLTGRKITSETGAYVLTGNAAGLIYTPTGGYNFAVETGAFTLTGNSANLLAQRKLGVTTGAFTLTGQEASLLFGRKIAVDTGVFALAGTPTTLTAARKILAGTGAYTFTGSAATLTSGATATYSKNTPLLIDSIGGKVLWIGLPKMSVWNTNGRPSAPTTGVVGFNSQTSAIEVWDGSNWKSVTLS